VGVAKSPVVVRWSSTKGTNLFVDDNLKNGCGNISRELLFFPDDVVVKGETRKGNFAP
jgi:hypothetical protein